MQIAEERLRFAVWFAAMNLDELRPGDWLNLRDDFSRFFGWWDEQQKEAAGGAFAVPPSYFGGVYPLPPALRADELSVDDFKVLQAKTRKVLRSVCMERDKKIAEYRRGKGLSSVEKVHIQLASVRWSLGPGFPPGVTHVFANGSSADLFLMIVMLLISQRDTAAIMLCRECGAMFVRVRHQVYCTRRCANRVNQRSTTRRKLAKQKKKKARRGKKR